METMMLIGIPKLHNIDSSICLVLHLSRKGLCILNSHLNAHLVIFPIQIQPNNININLIQQTFPMVQGDT